MFLTAWGGYKESRKDEKIHTPRGDRKKSYYLLVDLI